ncbi:cellulase family glycosylhydrolase [Gordonia sp. (in: high G+C Gram-positive bacteria)]|uniref:cellulase family glycosylhydrolase n=1 Tax=Gordonia sp. (in: high G+C Gram-positive bacteria) TaxID=84139 RepID=UPI003C75A3A4
MNPEIVHPATANLSVLRRHSTVATLTLAVVLLIGAIADPVGLLTVVGWSGASIRSIDGFWELAPYLLLVPIGLAGTWWTVRLFDGAHRRFAPVFAGTFVSLLVGKFATALASVAFVGSGALATAAWSTAFSVAKVGVAALIVATVVVICCRRGSSDDTTSDIPEIEWVGILAFAAIAPVIAGMWWTGATYNDAMPAPNPVRGPWSVVFGVIVLAAGTAFAAWLFRRRGMTSGLSHPARFMLGWYAAIVGGAILGVVSTAIGLFTGDGFSGDLWPVMSGYIRIADAVSYGLCLGWIVGLGTLLPAVTRQRSALVVTIVLAVVAVVVPTALFSPVNRSVAVPLTTEGGDLLPLHVRGDVIADAADREVLLRGVNVNQLVDFYAARPEVPATRPLTEADFVGMSDLGFNVVRLNLSWSALEPVRGKLDPAYLARIRTAVDQAAKQGMYTVLDMHQDGWWNGPSTDETSCRPGTAPMWGYDGAPDWATLTDGAPRCEFTGRDMSPAGDRAFNHFYYDSEGISTALARTWGELAGAFADQPAVAGFDLCNEPGFGESAPLTTSLLLGQFYDRAINEIRAAGAKQIVFFEPSILWSGLAFDGGPASDFTDDANIVFSPHLYAQSITMDASLGLPPFVSIERGFTLAERVAKEYDVPVWSGEFGYWGDDSTEYLERFAAEQDARRQGGAYWVWKQACGDPQNGIQDVGDGLMQQNCKSGGDAAAPPKSDLLTILTRAYPLAAPGQLDSLKSERGQMELTGTAGAGTCELRVWIPGTARPQVTTTGVSDVQLTAHGSGFFLTGCARGDYRVRT